MTIDPAEHASRSFAFGPFVLHPERQLLLQGETPVRIGGRALDLLTALVERPGEVVDKQELLSRVWPSTTVEESNLKVNMAALRRALASAHGETQYIATVTGRGYRFVAPVQRGAVHVTPTSAPPARPEPSATPRGRGLPAAMDRIIGRSEALEAIRRDLEASRLVSIVGDGGIGKTTVAIAVAHVLAATRADGAAFIDLATISDPQFIPAAIAAALGLGLSAGDPLAIVLHALEAQQKILVFDNCEHLLVPVAATVERLVRHLDGIQVLATTREPLRLREERIHRLRGLACAPHDRPSAELARTFPAVELFATRAAERAGYRCTDADAPAMAAICRRLDGNALAIELAATQTAAFDPQRILQMLDDRFRLLALGPRSAPLRQQSLLATLDWSYSLLSAPEAALLRAISVFAGAFAIDGAMAVSGADVDADAVLDALAQLAAKSLLATDTRGSTVTYRLLETTRGYAVDRLRISGQDEVVRRRHAEHVCAVLERATLEWAHLPGPAWGATYGHVLGDLRAALAWAGSDASARSLFIRLAGAGTLLWNHFSLTDECRVRVEGAVAELEAAGLAGSATEMRLQLALALAILYTQGIVPAVRAALERARALAIGLGDTDHHLRSLRLISTYQRFSGDYLGGLHTQEHFVNIATVQDPSAIAEGEVFLAFSEMFVGRLHLARQRLQPIYDHQLQPLNDARFVRFSVDTGVNAGVVLANVQWLTGSVGTAVQTTEASLRRALETGHHLSVTSALAVGACPVFYFTGMYGDADRSVGMLEDLSTRHGIVTWQPLVRFYQGALACARHDLETGVATLERAVDELHSINHLARLPFYLAVLADGLCRCGRLGDAQRTIDKALQFARDHEERWCMPEVLRIRASVLAARSLTAEAESMLVESMALAEETGALAWRLRAAIDLAMRWRTQGRASEARRLLQPVVERFTEGLQTRDLVVAADTLALLGRSRGRRGSRDPSG